MALPTDRFELETVKYANKSSGLSDKLAPADRFNPEKSTLLHGFSSVKQQTYGSHPLEKLERTNFERQQYRDMTILRSVQGIHAPLRLLTERRAASQIGHLPILPRSNLMLEVLDGRDEMIMPEDVFNDPREFNEVTLPVHLTLERELGF